MTSEPALHLRGTLAWTGGDMRVLWKNFRGFSDLASVVVAADRHTAEWRTTAPIPLRPGVNHVRIQALGQPGAAAFVNIFYAARDTQPPPVLGTTWLHGRQITYEVVDGRAVYQNDMILGDETEAARGRFAGRLARGGLRLRPQSATITPGPVAPTGLWPVVSGVVRVPYTMTSVNATNINSAINESNTQLAGVVQWVPATGSDVNLVNFNFNAADLSGTCEAIVGMQGGTQPISGSAACGVNTILHEMGHALGLYHEQSRSDRNTYVSYSESYVDKPQASNFDQLQDEAISGLYNYASIMEYGPFLFSRYGIYPVLETIPAGMVLSSDLPEYTSGDLDGIKRLYGFAPTSVTVDTNPTGLQLMVDSVPCTAPCVFTNWAIGSQHTLSVPLDSHNQTLQTLGKQPYILGRWNAGTASAPYPQSVAITNSAGDGTLLSPPTAPAITNYLASFIPVHPYNPVVGPAGAATISPNPAPNTLIINGKSTSYYTDRQQIALTVTPASGYSFYDWANVPLDNFYQKFYNFFITSNFDYLNFDTSKPVTAYLVTDPVLTVTGSAAQDVPFALYPGLAVGIVEGGNGNATQFAYTPQNFDQSNDGIGFKPGSGLTLCASGLNGTSCPSSPVPQSPVTTNISYLFTDWSGFTGSSNNALSLSMPASSQTMTASYAYSFRVIVLPSPYCTAGGLSVNTSPAVTSSNPNGGLDAFFGTGTTSFVASPGSSGLNFSAWTGDLGGSASPYQQTVLGELIATANFNVSGTTQALTISKISPAAPVTNTATTITLTGTGFTTSSSLTAAYVGPVGGTLLSYATTLQSSTQMTIQVPAGLFTAPGYYQVLVQNTAAGGCGPQAVFTFPVTVAPPPTLTSISVTALSLSIAKGLTDQFTATGTYSDSSTQNLTAQVTWASQTTADVTISSGGLATAAGIGSSKITATLGAVSGNATLTVTPATLVSIAVTPVNPSITVGGAQQFAATGTYTDSTTQNLTSSATWASTNTAAATIVSGGANAGKASGVGTGSSTVSASTSGPTVSNSTTLTVTAGALNPCDVNQDGHFTVADVQAIVNQGLGKSQAVSDLNSDHVVNAVDVQIVINAVLSLGCTP